MAVFPYYFFFVGRCLRLVDAISSSWRFDIDSAIWRDAPFNDFLLRSPRLAESAAPAAICCFFDCAGMM